MLSQLLLSALVCVGGTLAAPRPYNQLPVPSNYPPAPSLCSSHSQCTSTVETTNVKRAVDVSWTNWGSQSFTTSTTPTSSGKSPTTTTTTSSTGKSPATTSST